jgi:ABC-type sugar transport system permease subunit
MSILVNIEFILLAAASGFATSVWLIAARNEMSRWRTIGYVLLALSYAVAGSLIVAILIERPFLVPRGLTSLILIPIFAIPPWIHFWDWLRARRIIDDVRRGVR